MIRTVTLTLLMVLSTLLFGAEPEISFTIPDTGQTYFFDEDGKSLNRVPKSGDSSFGQDAQYSGIAMSYRDNKDGTITDLNTGLMWLQSPGEKKTYSQATKELKNYEFAGYSDWRLPTIKEIYSLMDFNGVDPSGLETDDVSQLTPFINTEYFSIEYGDTSNNERIIDSQFLTSSIYVDKTMGGDDTMFGLNLVDGRIKGYPYLTGPGGTPKTFFGLYVRGEEGVYGNNDFIDNGDGTISDRATTLMWSKSDRGAMDWVEALEYAESANIGGYSDWRLPNAKELQSIVDYERSPATTNSAAIDPIFDATPIKDEEGNIDYAFYWTGTTHINTKGGPNAVYIAFGRALGFISSKGSKDKALTDVHGAGAQRSDPKVGDRDDLPSEGHGPQGDVQRIYNYVRLVRDDTTSMVESGTKVATFTTTQDVKRPNNTMSVKKDDRNSGSDRAMSAKPMDDKRMDNKREPNFERAARELGITVNELKKVLGAPKNGQPDFEAAARKLDISAKELMELLGISR